MLTWALWFGGLIALFVFVKTLFNNSHEIAVQAAPQLFVMFQMYHLILAAIALISTVIWRITTGQKITVAIFILLSLAACTGVAIAIWYVGPMEALRRNGLSASPAFARLHGQSMGLYLLQAALLFACGVMFPAAIRGADAKKATETAPAQASPA
jgi:hypothetical protein